MIYLSFANYDYTKLSHEAAVVVVIQCALDTLQRQKTGLYKAQRKNNI